MSNKFNIYVHTSDNVSFDKSKSKVNTLMSHQLTLVQELGNMNQSIYFYSIIRFVNVNE